MIKKDEVIIKSDFAQKLYDFLNEVNVPFEQKELLIYELRASVERSIKIIEDNLKSEEDGKD